VYDRTKFFDGYRAKFGRLDQNQVNGLSFLLRAFELDSRWADIRNVAYALATCMRETAHTFQPIHEIGSDVYLSKYWTNPRLRNQLGNIQPTDAQTYKGRGYCQITGRANYRRFGLENDPEKALEPQTAFEIMTKGMFDGLFTGAKLGHYIHNGSTNYVAARHVVNGTDHSLQIAHDAEVFEGILREAQT
jgi:hypothetical protein